MPAGYGFSLNTNTPGEVRLVVQVTAVPTIASVSAVGGQLVMSGTGGPPNGIFYQLTATNVAQPLIQWVRLTTNQFSAAGAFALTNAIDASQPGRFYRLQLP